MTTPGHRRTVSLPSQRHRRKVSFPFTYSMDDTDDSSRDSTEEVSDEYLEEGRSEDGTSGESRASSEETGGQEGSLEEHRGENVAASSSPADIAGFLCPRCASMAPYRRMSPAAAHTNHLRYHCGMRSDLAPQQWTPYSAEELVVANQDWRDLQDQCREPSPVTSLDSPSPPRLPSPPQPMAEVSRTPTTSFASRGCRLANREPIEVDPGLQLPSTNPVADEIGSPGLFDHVSTASQIDAAFYRLINLPKPPDVISPQFSRLLVKLMDRLGGIYAAAPTAFNLLVIMAVPKLLYGPCAADRGLKWAKITELFEAYPRCQPPQPARRDNVGTTAPHILAEKAIEAGRASKAVRILCDTDKPIEVTDEVFAKLQDKHPPASSRSPFGADATRRLGIRRAAEPPAELIETAVKSFKHDVGAGPSGWNAPLLKLAANSSPGFKDALRVLCLQVLDGSAAGSNLLRASKLIAISKRDGGLRPIAIGEIFYRLATKVALKFTWSSGNLERWQLGVGSIGGVEPLIALLQRVYDGTSHPDHLQVTSLDFSNAFNSISRTAVANGVWNHARILHKAARWAYATPSALLIAGENDSYRTILSAEGVRQGDPLGPALFSLAIRDTLVDLRADLRSQLRDPKLEIAAYLDDIYILSKPAAVIKHVAASLANNSAGLKLNINKCSEVSVAEIQTSGLPVLGSLVGPLEVRRKFLQDKIEQQKQRLTEVHSMQSHHGYKALSHVILGELRHLLRCLDSSDLEDVWQSLDRHHQSLVQAWRGSLADTAELSNTEKTIVGLPIKMGGCGITQFEPIVDLCRKSSAAMSDCFLQWAYGDGDEPRPSNGQKTSVMHHHLRQWDDLGKSLSLEDAKVLVDNSSELGRLWLQAPMHEAAYRLNNAAFAANLAMRTLRPLSTGPCLACGQQSTSAHAYVCPCIARRLTAHHNFVCHRIKYMLDAAMPNGTVTMEPRPPNGYDDTYNRTDLRMTGAASTVTMPMEIDISLMAPNRERRDRIQGDIQLAPILSTDDNPSGLPNQTHTSASLGRRQALELSSDIGDAGTVGAFGSLIGLPPSLAAADKKLRQNLARIAQLKEKKHRDRLGPSTKFIPFVLSLGGTLEGRAWDLYNAWKKLVGPYQFKQFRWRLANGLAHARGEIFWQGVRDCSA